MIIELKLPELSKDENATIEIAEWFKKPGDSFEQDDSLAELLLDKAAFDLNAPSKGKLIEIRAEQGANVKVGDVIALIEVGS